MAAAVSGAFRAVPWRNALSGRWWWRRFKKSIYDSGRLSTFLFLILLLGVQFSDPGAVRLIRARVFDFYQQTKPRPLLEESPVVIIDIDEKSLAEQGQFPWPRSVLADLVTRATAIGVDAIGFDIMMPEEDQTSVSKVIARVPDQFLDQATRARLIDVPTNDKLLADAIAASGKVVLGQNSFGERRDYKGEPPLTSFAILGDDPTPFLEQNVSVLRPLRVLNEAAAGRGLVSLSEKYFDGIVRQVPMVVSAGGDNYPALSLEMLRVKLGAKTINIKTDAARGGVSEVSMRPARSRDRYQVKTDSGAQVWVYFRPHESLQNIYISATDILNDRVPKERLAGKLALVGTSATGLLDLRSTPLNAVLPGVEVHANVLENIIFKTQLTRPPTALIMEWITIFVVGMIMIVITPMVGARVGVVTFLAIAGALIWYSWNAFSTRLELYDPTFAVAVALFFYIFLTYIGYTREESQRKQVRSAFGQYLSPALVQKLAEDPSKLALGGENRDMTFMFSDIRGFTSISELFDAQGLTRLINRLLTPLTNVILSNSGTIDKYMGDCVMAFWNAPLEVKDHAASACRAALAMVGEVKKVNIVLKAEAEQEGREHRKLAVGIGVNSGIACVGNMGSEQRFDYSVLGDNVNLASRLEGQSKNYGVTIVLGENTAIHADGFAVLELDLIKVKGKAQAVRIFTLVGGANVAATGWFKELKVRHDTALVAYRAQQWDQAEAEIAACRKILESQTGLPVEMLGFYAAATERIDAFRITPPPADWDGVYVAESK
jgi:adenylate cyclase